MKVIICGGGTGGHIYPALSIADCLVEKRKNTEILFIGTAAGLESTLVPQKGYAFKTIRVRGFRRKLSLDTLKTLIELARGLTDASRVLKEFRPDIVIGTGGYVAGPVLLIAALKGVPTLVHEQNVLPGVTNRILGRFVDRIAVSFEEAKKHFSNTSKVVVTGNPVRKEILGNNKEMSTRAFGFEPGIPLVLIFGGSRGSSKLNNAVLDVMSRITAQSRVQLLHVTGEAHFEYFSSELKSRGIDLDRLYNVKVVPYMHRMPDALAAADVVVTSSGAITLAEITAIGVPSILIPKAHATDNHQEYNARAMEGKGAATVILEKELSGERLYTEINRLVNDKRTLAQMREASRMLGRTDAADRIFDVVSQMLKL
ncbi:MAG: UDP-N-acetylglucosamine--N-acetylmuramyl-(pentapeptide) pyrophosphoryl-undecaprenol N-acetylglucosamine transferase [Firmicutes bacterium]|nr:UDP-N-acetylglucosamine--N-acetylmuramyl-(pentapeptide) pyrophosphoryl-undecaprenol N-acetylglucosamine transferase [Bacillota bacterium]MDI6706320.1 undecaprenyldiphospho-muramoylpentapeptide beta-N-acetylglucosaminyltransferase [Bacillota bacterium]